MTKLGLAQPSIKGLIALLSPFITLWKHAHGIIMLSFWEREGALRQLNKGNANSCANANISQIILQYKVRQASL